MVNVERNDELREIALFAGAGGGILGGKLLGWRTVCAVELDPYAASVLCARQNDGVFPPFPIWDDVCTFDGRPWCGRVDVISGGFPCQDISVAGRGAGITGERSGLWKEFARIIGEVRPRYVLVENSPALTTRGLGTVLGDLAALGFDAEWGVLGASDAGAPHRRERIWILAYSMLAGQRRVKREGQTKGDALAYAESAERQRIRPKPNRQPNGSANLRADVADADNAQRQGNQRQEREREKHANISRPSWWRSEPNVGRVAHGVAARAHRLRAIGNGQVPQCMALAWQTLFERKGLSVD